jgi:hypothetical protein
LLTIEKEFEPDMLFLTANTIFRNPPDLDIPLEKLFPSTGRVYAHCLILQRRLFYLGLYAGHVPSALTLWRSLSAHPELLPTETAWILRCLKQPKLEKETDELRTLADICLKDHVGDVPGAIKSFSTLELSVLAPYETLWRRSTELHLQLNKIDKAVSTVLSGRALFSERPISHLLRHLHAVAPPEWKMSLHVQLIPFSYGTKDFTWKTAAEGYEARGERALAREFYEMDAWINLDRGSREWVLRYEREKCESWWGRWDWRRRNRLGRLEEMLGFPGKSPVEGD